MQSRRHLVALTWGLAMPIAALSANTGLAAAVLSLDPPPALEEGPGLGLDGPDADQPPELTGPPVPSKALLQELHGVCTDVAGPDAAAYDRAREAGWLTYDEGAVDGGPYRRFHSSFKGFAGYGDIDLTSSVATFGDIQLGYCRLDFNDLDTRIDFADLTGVGGLAGSVTADGALAHGAWSTTDHRTLVIADRTAEGVVEIEFNLLPAAAPQP